MAKKREEKQPREYTKRQLSHAKKQERRQKIILFSGISVIVVIILLIMSGWFFGEYYPLNKTIVKVFDTKIKQSAFIDSMVFYGTSQSSIDLAQYADYILNNIVQNELIRRDAEKLGITASDQEVNDQVKAENNNLNDGMREIVRASILTKKLKDDYFSKQVPDTGNQVMMNAMLVESEELVPGLRDRLINGDNFTALADEFALNTVSKNNKGIFEWHPADVLKTQIGYTVPVDWAFSTDVKTGDISPALSDNSSNKQLGYWLIKVNNMDKDDEVALVQALLLADKAQAERVKPLLEATDNISSLVDKYSQHSQSIQGHGDMGEITDTDNVSDPFYNYVFNPNTKIGEWSDPVKDTTFWTKGGAWIVQIAGKEDNRTYSDQDKSKLVDDAYSTWTTGLWAGAAADINYTLDDSQKTWAIQQATKKISVLTGK